MYKEVRIGEVYKHFKKGTHYVVVGFSRYSEDGGRLVEYRNIETGEKWSRPYESFTNYAEIEQGKVKRFEKVSL